MAERVITGGWRDDMETEPFSIATTSHGSGVVFRREERERHVWIIGKSGSGKSTFLFNLVMGDICAGEGVAVIDPHGDLAEDILDAIPRRRINDVCYLDAGEAEYPVGFNPATRIAPERRALAASGIVAAFKHLWSDSWGPRLEHFLFHGVAALVSREHATLIDLARLYTDDRFREHVVSRVTDPETLRFWEEEFPSYTKSLRSDAIAPVLNKVGQIAASPHLRLILGQVAPRLDLSFTMNNRRILVANLAKGTIGEQAANLLGSLLVSHLQLIAMERGTLPPEQRVPFFAHIDEFQTFSSDAFASLLSEARKFALHFCLANQYTDQLSHAVRSAVIGNAGTLVVFRVGSRDAELLAPEFRPMDPAGLADQEPFTAWLRRGIGRDRIFVEDKQYLQLGTAEAIREQSRQRFGRFRGAIERQRRMRL
ncbi:MAG: type IV secretory system conjugative DNA transfer family protein [Xanthobacteraceae bacterium]